MAPVKSAGSEIPVLVLGSYVTVLGTIRCLGWKKISSLCITPVDSYITWSRYHRSPGGGGDLLTEPSRLETYLRGLSLDRAVLMPCADDWVRAVASLPEELRARFPASLPSLATVESLLDKDGLRELLERFDVPHPVTIPLTGAEDLQKVRWEEGGRWFLKPTDSQAFRRHFGVKALPVANEAEARERFAHLRNAGLECVLQEYVPGGADRHYFVDGFVDREGRIKALFARRRLRIHPPDFGDSSNMVSVSLEEVAEAVDACRRLLAGMSYRGVFSSEFKLDPRDGRFKLIEVNVRPWAYVQFAGSSGLNMPWMAYLDALGQDVPAVESYATGRRFLFWPADLFAARRQWLDGRLSFREWAASWWGAETAVFHWRDPAPALRQTLSLLAAALRRCRPRSSRSTPAH